MILVESSEPTGKARQGVVGVVLAVVGAVVVLVGLGRELNLAAVGRDYARRRGDTVGEARVDGVAVDPCGNGAVVSGERDPPRMLTVGAALLVVGTLAGAAPGVDEVLVQVIDGNLNSVVESDREFVVKAVDDKVNQMFFFEERRLADLVAMLRGIVSETPLSGRLLQTSLLDWCRRISHP